MAKYTIRYTSKSSPNAAEIDVAWSVERTNSAAAVGAVAGDLAADPNVHSFHITHVEEETAE